MTDIKDLVGLEKPLIKLVETINEGLGVVGNQIFKFDAKKIKRIGEAKAEADKLEIVKKAEGQAKAIAILDRASKRFALEQYNKQINLENIIASTKDRLVGKTVSDDKVDKDWTSRFMGIAQDISREELRQLLSKILAGEIIQPGTFALRTLEQVKNLNLDELNLFKKFITVSSNNSLIYVTKNDTNDGFFNLTYADIMKMIELGYIQSSITTVLNIHNIEPDKRYSFNFKNGTYVFKALENQDRVELPVLPFTTIGSEIASLIEIDTIEEKVLSKYIKDLKEFWLTKKLDFIEFINK